MPSFVLSATKLRSFQSIHFLSPSLPSICPHLTPSGPSILQSLPLCAITGLHYACRLFVPLTDLLRCTHDSPASVLSRVQCSTQSNALWAMAALEGSTGRPDGPRSSYLLSQTPPFSRNKFIKLRTQIPSKSSPETGLRSMPPTTIPPGPNQRSRYL
jgi:hypothetical protein